MTDQEWDALCLLIEEAWPGEFDDNARVAWRTLLDGFTAEEIAAGLKGMLVKGGTFRPSVGELVSQIRSDPSRPTFIEMFQLVYGRRGVLRAREPYRGPVLDPDESRARAAKARLAECHPLVASFVERYGLKRLRLLELNDPEYGEARRKELREAWDLHVQAMDGRAVAAAVASSHRGDLGRLDPLAVLAVSESGGDLNA